MRFNEVLAGVTPDGDAWSCMISEHWTQGRTVFGGLQTAVAVRALRNLVPGEVPLRVVQTTFIAPVPAGPLRLLARVLRSGKSAIHTECRLVDGDQTLCLVVAIFGTARQSSVTVAPTRPDAPGAEDPNKELPYIPGVVPVFTQQFQFRWSEGGMPYTGAREPRTKIHIRHRDQAVLDETHVIALADTIPSPGISLFRKPSPSSSLTWTLEILDHDYSFAGDQWWRMDAEISAGGGGYLAQTAELWNPAGRLAALSRQSVVVFA
jgi:acyl-CoA thioesterase